MVALLIRLNWTLFIRSLRGKPWAVVGLVVGAMGGLSLLFAVGASATALRVFAADLVGIVGVLAGSALVIAAIVYGVVVGAGDPLAPERFALLPVRARQLQPAMFVAALTDVSGIVIALALVLGLIAWSTAPLTFAAALLMLPVAVATALTLAKAVAELLAKQLASRKMRDMIAIAVFLLACSTGLVMQGILQLLRNAPSIMDQLQTVASVLAWTPFGAVFGVTASVSEGNWLQAAAQFAIALATLGGGWWLWGRMLHARLQNPVTSASGGRVREGKLLDRLLPATQTGAIATRIIRYTRRDARHLMNLLATIFVVALIAGVTLMNLQGEGASLGYSELLMFLPLLMTFVFTSVVQLSASYDNSAFALHVLAGVPGRIDRAGRALGLGVIYLPLIVLTGVLATVPFGRIDLLPSALAIAIGPALFVLGFNLWLGVYLPGQTPEPGANPLAKNASGGGQAFIGLGVNALATGLAMLPILGTAIGAIWLPWLGYLSVALALILGPFALWAGIRFGGRALDARYPKVLAEVSSS